ncbi:MAG: DUF5916 domain-containing protein [Ferruginibacter sp.]
MTKKTVPILFVSCMLLLQVVYATDPPKKLNAQRLSSPIKIDGIPDDAAWKDAPVATDFVEMRPNFGAVENAANRTEVRILYDNSAIYVSGFCHEQTIDSVSHELAGRDRVGSNDFVGVIFDTYYDKINASGFYVMASGEQYDAKYSNTNGEDDSWNAVWQSESKIVKDGWTFEMKIPYSALRFSGKVSDWGLNITRRRQKTGQQYMWNPVSPTVSGFINQEGMWTGISNIKSPVRLSFSPYFSTYVNHYKQNDPTVDASVNGGMDVKYGLSPSYTLDMTLIPDFGEVASDKTILNLSPFETRYAENRPFFTEGTELFQKGNLFYSRRIGATPIHYGDIDNSSSSTYKVLDNPSQAKLINATKISGRNPSGFGIGFLNALQRPMDAEVEDKNTHQKYKIKTSTLTNYNVIVLDQTLKHNSSVSLVNTNVWRSGSDYDANVTAAVFDFNNKKNVYNVNGKFALSDITQPGKDITGYSHTLSTGKTGGRFNFNFTEDLADEKYNTNDLGILYNNNYLDHYLWFGYKWVKPHGWYNNLYLNFNNNLSNRFKDGKFQSYTPNINLNGQLKNLWYAGVLINYSAPGNDFYEPRKDGRVFKTATGYGGEIWMNTNSAKKYFFSFDASMNFKNLFNGRSYYLYVENRYRFNDKLSVTLDVNINPSKNDVGYNSTASDTVFFSRRDIKTLDNTLAIKYNFTKNSGITVNVRHYWRHVISKEVYILNTDGSLTDSHSNNQNADYNVNYFTVDMVYSWQFAPGSFMYLVWKNGINNFEQNDHYFKNLNTTLGTSQNNNLSIKLIYYLDYLKLRKKHR